VAAIKPNPDAYTNMGAMYIYVGRYADAIPLLEEAIRMGENECLTWSNLADSYRYTPKYADKAPATYKKAIQLAREQLDINPKNALLRACMAVYYAKLGDHDTALTEITMALKQVPDEMGVLYKSVIVHELASRREQALEALKQALETGEGMSTEEVQNEPELTALRRDPAYARLINK
jgi:tetratricopeptide (TPR) repeat protein